MGGTEPKQAGDFQRLIAHAVESIAEAVSITDLDDRFTFVNRAFLGIYGYTREEVLGRHVSLVWSPDNPPELQAEILDRTRAGGWKGELLSRTKDGREFPIALSASYIRDDGGMIRGLVGIAEDITARKQAEETVLARALQLEAVRTVTAEITRELDLTTLLGLITQRSIQLVGASAGSIYLWDEAGEVLIPRAWHGLGEWMREVRLKPGEAVAGTVAQRQEGMVVNDFPASPYAFPLFQERAGTTAVLAEPLLYRDRLVGVITLTHNQAGRQFTEKHQSLLRLLAAQAAIAIENARLHKSAQRSAQRATVLNKLTRSLMGSLNPQEVTQKILEAVQILIPGAAITLREREGELLHLRGRAGFEISAERPATPVGGGLAGITAATAKPMIYEDVSRDPRVLDKTWIERERLVSCAVIPLIFAQQVRGTISIYTRARHRFSEKGINLLQAFADAASIATENARLHDVVRRHAAELEERVCHRTAELEEALRVKTEFLATMSHELRTPLNAVIGFSQLLQQGTPGPLTPKQARYVDRIHEGGKRLLELVTAILDVAQAETGTSRLHLESVALGPLVQEVLDVVQDQVTQKRLLVTTSLDSGPAVVAADRGKLSQILAHLVGNAVKFTPEGGRVTVTARRVTGIADGRLQIADLKKREATPQSEILNLQSEITGDCLEVAVEDSGIGIRPEDRESIFEAFHQVDGSASRAYGGAGLGLTLVRKLVELHGGRVWAESAGLGRGSRFIVRLPRPELPQ